MTHFFWWPLSEHLAGFTTNPKTFFFLPVFTKRKEAAIELLWIHSQDKKELTREFCVDGICALLYFKEHCGDEYIISVLTTYNSYGCYISFTIKITTLVTTLHQAGTRSLYLANITSYISQRRVFFTAVLPCIVIRRPLSFTYCF